MRPLDRPALSSAASKSVAALPLLMRAFGAYCCFSEEPIFDVAAVWNRTLRAEVAANRPPGDQWEDSLIVSPTTLEAARRPNMPMRVGPLFPDLAQTFSLDTSPFTYALERVEMTLLDEAGRPQGNGEFRQLAVVRGTTPAAQATIDAFALNTPYFSPADNTLRIPATAYLAREDNRLFLRTDVWGRAEEVAALISRVNEASRPTFLDHVRMLAAASGFWSVWATVLWRRFSDREMLARVLLPPKVLRQGKQVFDRRVLGIIGSVDAGVQNAFPGTRSDWLRGS